MESTTPADEHRLYPAEYAAHAQDGDLQADQALFHRRSYPKSDQVSGAVLVYLWTDFAADIKGRSTPYGLL